MFWIKQKMVNICVCTWLSVCDCVFVSNKRQNGWTDRAQILIDPREGLWKISKICLQQNSIFIIICKYTKCNYIQGYPQRIRLQRRLYGICLVRFLAFRVPCRPKLVYFCAESLNKPTKYSFESRNQKSSFKS